MNPSATEFVLERPMWLAAIALMPLVVVYFRRSLVHLPAWHRAASLGLRCLLIVVLILGLAGPKLRMANRQVFLVVASDTSRSIGAEAAAKAKAFRQGLSESAGGMVIQEFAFPEDASRAPTDLAAAILSARARVPANRVPRILLLSDGNSTSGDTLGAAVAAGCEIDVVPLPHLRDEVYVDAVEAPGEVRYEEPFFVDVVVQSLRGGEGRIKLHMKETLVDDRSVVVLPGSNRFRFRYISTGEPFVRLSAELNGFPDTIAENNFGTAVVFTRPKPRILIVDPQPQLAGVLREALESGEQFQVDVRPAHELPERLDSLLEYDLLVVSNVPAAELSKRQVHAVGQYVHDYGGGLIVVGGNRAFTAGDYAGTPLEAMLPVAMYDKPDKPKPSLAMVLVLDRSGSMQGTPIELARQAARQAVARLGREDQVGILAFEDRMHWVVAVQSASEKEHVMARIDTIVAGGGTNMFPALDHAYLALRGAHADLKHIIVLSDGVSHPGDFDTLVRRIAEDGITVSTVGVGDEASEEFLRKIAEIAAGQAYFCTDPAEVPRIFELEVLAAGKHGITEEPFRPEMLRPARMLAAFDPSGVPPLLGYVDTQAKPGSQLLLNSPSGDPLLAWWRYGRGVSMAFTSDIHNRWAAAWHRWPGFGSFWTSLARQAMRGDASRRFTPDVMWRGRRAEVILDAVDEDGRWLNSADVRVRVNRPGSQPGKPVPCELIKPGRYATEMAADAPGEYHLEFTVEAEGESAHVIRRGFAVDFGDELRIRPTNTALLEQIASQSGGLFEPTPADVLRPAETTVSDTLALWPWLFSVALILFVLDVAVKRTGRSA